MRNLVVIVLDSLRHDTCLEAETPNLDRLGTVERRWSYASWTAPSHHNLVMGLPPHSNPPRVYASDLYQEEYGRYSDRLDVDGIEFRSLLPALNLPTFLRDHLGYRTVGRVSMPVLNPATAVNTGFDDYRLMQRHNDFGAIIDDLEFSGSAPTYALLNVGETHYPYATADEDPSEWPRVSGVHGTLKRMGESAEDAEFFSPALLDQMRARQVRAVERVDELLGDLFEQVPADTWMMVLSDHGELFGEDGYFGHGPIVHEKVFEVPFVEGPVPRA